MGLLRNLLGNTWDMLTGAGMIATPQQAQQLVEGAQPPAEPQMQLSAPEKGLLPALQSAYREYVPDVIQDAASNLQTLGSIFGLDDPSSAAGGSRAFIPPMKRMPVAPKMWKGGMREAIQAAAGPKIPVTSRRVAKYLKDTEGQTHYANARTVLDDGKGKRVVIGPTTPMDMAPLVRDNLGSDEAIREAADWYRQMEDAIKQQVGDKNYKPWMVGFALSQAGDSPSAGIRNVLISERLAAGLPESKMPGTAGKYINEIMAGKPPSGGVGTKIADFGDSLESSPTRTIAGDIPEHGMPVAVDRHNYRLSGRIDPGYKNWLIKTFGKERVAKLDLDSPVEGMVPTSDYEPVAKLMRDTADYFNEIKFASKTNWTPAEAQAATWVAFRKMLGLPVESPRASFMRNTAKMPTELSFGKGSPADQMFGFLEGLPWKVRSNIANDVLEPALDDISKMFGVRFDKAPMTIGGWERSVNPSKRISGLGTDSAIEDANDALALYANQTMAYAYKPVYHVEDAAKKSMDIGKARAAVTGSAADTTGMDIIGPKLFTDRVKLNQFFSRLHEVDPHFAGFTLEQFEGRPVLRTLADAGTKWTTADYRKMEQSINQVADEFKIKEPIVIDWIGVKSNTAFNDWQKGGKHGEDYLKRLATKHGPETAKRVAEYSRTNLPTRLEKAVKKYAPGVWESVFPDGKFDWDTWNNLWKSEPAAVTSIAAPQPTGNLF